MTSAPYSQIQLDAQWSISAVDEAFETITGFAPDTALGTRFDALVSPRDRRGATELDKQRVTYQGGRIDVMLQLCAGAGDRLVRLRASRTGERWTAWVEDLLSHSNDTLQRLNAETEWSRNVVSRSDEGVVILTPENTVTKLNQTAMNLLSVRSDDGILLSYEVMTGSQFFDLVPQATFGPLAEATRRAAKKKKLRVSEDIQHEGKDLQIRLTALHLPVRGHVGSMLSIRDITAQRALERMSQELRLKNEDIRVILSNLDLGILTIEDESLVHPEFSERLPSLLGTQNIAGRDVTALLFGSSNVGPDDLARLQTALELTLGESTFGFELNRDCFPDRFSIQVGGETRELEADWVPVESDDDTVHRILVVLRDVTELNRLRNEAHAQQQELTMIGELVSIPEDAFDEYATACHLGLAQTLGSARGEPIDATGLARTVHTLKGNARAWGLKSMCDAIHELEEVLLASDRDNNELAARATTALGYLESYERLSRDKLNRGGSVGATTHKDQRLLREVFELVVDNPSALPPALRQLATSAAYLPARARLDAIAEKLATHAAREGKPNPRFRFPPSLLVHRQRLDQLYGAFVHLLTNAVDHGLEPTAERISAGKDPRGTIRMTAERTNQGVVLVVKDDGRGLALSRLKAKAGHEALTAQTAERLVFDPGVSTAERVTQSSGRGMGMAAVRSEVADLGGTIKIEFDAFNASDEYAQFEFRIVLPHATARLETIEDALGRAA